MIFTIFGYYKNFGFSESARLLKIKKNHDFFTFRELYYEPNVVLTWCFVLVNLGILFYKIACMSSWGSEGGATWLITKTISWDVRKPILRQLWVSLSYHLLPLVLPHVSERTLPHLLPHFHPQSYCSTSLLLLYLQKKNVLFSKLAEPASLMSPSNVSSPP